MRTAAFRWVLGARRRTLRATHSLRGRVIDHVKSLPSAPSAPSGPRSLARSPRGISSSPRCRSEAASLSALSLSPHEHKSPPCARQRPSARTARGTWVPPREGAASMRDDRLTFCDSLPFLGSASLLELIDSVRGSGGFRCFMLSCIGTPPSVRSQLEAKPPNGIAIHPPLARCVMRLATPCLSTRCSY